MTSDKKGRNMVVPSSTILTLLFKCPWCVNECRWVGEMYALREVATPRGGFHQEIVTLEANCSECDKYLSIQVNPIDPDIPKPRTTRPFRRGEVKCGDVFRSKDSKRDYMTCAVDDTHVSLHQAGSVTYKYIFDNFLRLTYDSEGREVLSEAGIEE